MGSNATMPGPRYWVVVALLLAFGVVAMFSIGAPFLILGLTLAVMAPLRDRIAVFWPSIIGVVAFFVGYVLVAPLSCTASETATDDTAATSATVRCASLLGPTYQGTGGYEPPRWPGLVAGLGTAAIGAVGTRLVVVDSSGRRDARTG